MNEMVRAEGLGVVYNEKDEKPVLDGLDFSVREVERIALMGAFGAGKSTLLLTLTGVLLPHKGALVVNGIQVKKENLRELRRGCGLVFQNPDDQIFMPTVEDDVSFGPGNYGMDEAEIKERVEKILASLGIGELRGRLAHHLSGGEKRLAALAGILVMEPALLLLDEPLAFLDPAARRRLIAVLQGLPQTMILSTHDGDMARGFCSRCMVLRKGRICADGPPGEILACPDRLLQWGL
jgi:cobalt/nickel transport system ATP-binding protein